MRNHPAGVAARHFVSAAVIFALTMPILAQQPIPSPSSRRTDSARTRHHEMRRREMQLRNYGGGSEKPVDPKRLQALAAQVEQDFERILILHNEIVRAITASNTLNHDFVSSAAAEIKKRASRLQTTLSLARPDAGAQDQERQTYSNDAQVKDALIRLCKQIESFVANPIIETPGTVDIQQLDKARHDLNDVIELGDSIKKSVDRLKKSAR